MKSHYGVNRSDLHCLAAHMGIRINHPKNRQQSLRRQYGDGKKEGGIARLPKPIRILF